MNSTVPESSSTLEQNLPPRQISDGDTSTLQVYNEYDRLVRLLDSVKRIDIEREDKNGMTVFMRACVFGDTDVVRLLLATGRIKVNKKDRMGVAALISSSTMGFTEIVRLLLATDGIDVNIQVNGITALSVACMMGHIEVVKLLLAARGIDVNIQILKDGCNALIYASRLG
jgi:ankyrin repeat protein